MLKRLQTMYRKLKRKYIVWSLKRRFRNRLRERREKWVKPMPPRYDEVYEEGVKWLDSLE